MLEPRFFDCNHNNAVDYDAVVTWAWGACFKATQGLGFTDHAFAPRRAAMEARGVLVAAYDFSTADNVLANVNWFFDVVNPGAHTGMVLDFEDNPHSPMSGNQAYEFLDRVNQRLGRAATIYGGNRIREHIDSQDPKWIDMAKVVPLWLCQYKAIQVDTLQELDAHIHVPGPWKDWTYLQYAADGLGPRPHKMPGVENGADLNVFDGTRDQFTALWPGPALPTLQVVGGDVGATKS